MSFFHRLCCPDSCSCFWPINNSVRKTERQRKTHLINSCWWHESFLDGFFHYFALIIQLYIQPTTTRHLEGTDILLTTQDLHSSKMLLSGSLFQVSWTHLFLLSTVIGVKIYKSNLCMVYSTWVSIFWVSIFQLQTQHHWHERISHVSSDLTHNIALFCFDLIFFAIKQIVAPSVQPIFLLIRENTKAFTPILGRAQVHESRVKYSTAFTVLKYSTSSVKFALKQVLLRKLGYSSTPSCTVVFYSALIKSGPVLSQMRLGLLEPWTPGLILPHTKASIENFHKRPWYNTSVGGLWTC